MSRLTNELETPLIRVQSFVHRREQRLKLGMQQSSSTSRFTAVPIQYSQHTNEVHSPSRFSLISKQPHLFEAAKYPKEPATFGQSIQSFLTNSFLEFAALLLCASAIAFPSFTALATAYAAQAFLVFTPIFVARNAVKRATVQSHVLILLFTALASNCAYKIYMAYTSQLELVRAEVLQELFSATIFGLCWLFMQEVRANLVVNSYVDCQEFAVGLNVYRALFCVSSVVGAILRPEPAALPVLFLVAIIFAIRFYP